MALLQASDVIAGLSGYGIEAAVRPSQANAKEFAKYTVISILSRMISTPTLDGTVKRGNQQYVFAGIAGAAISGGNSESMVKSGVYAVGATYLGDLIADKLDLERDIIGGNNTAAPTSTP